jgi:hypothetical protein
MISTTKYRILFSYLKFKINKILKITTLAYRLAYHWFDGFVVVVVTHHTFALAVVWYCCLLLVVPRCVLFWTSTQSLKQND